jgi:hypothetical protein
MNRINLIAGIVIVLAMVGVFAVYLFPHTSYAPAQQPAGTTTQAAATTTTTTTVPSKPGIPVPTVHAFGAVTLSLGETARFTGVSIVPLSIIEDSRCPLGVMCIQAGTVRVSTRVTTSAGSVVQTLALNQPFTIGGDTITLTEVQPIRRHDTIAASDYRLTFDIEKGAPVATGKCYVGGCSSEVCSDQPGAVSSCIYRSQYACYHTATCERQASGQCGWTPTAELNSCIANADSTTL